MTNETQIALPGGTDCDAFVAEQWPDLPHQQQRSVATWLHDGWAVTGIGRHGEVNLTRGAGLSAERGYIRPDGVYRPE